VLCDVSSARNMMSSQKVPRIVALDCNGRTYSSTYLITFKVGLLHAFRAGAAKSDLDRDPETTVIG
jgi:hypothetical protein